MVETGGPSPESHYGYPELQGRPLTQHSLSIRSTYQNLSPCLRPGTNGRQTTQKSEPGRFETVTSHLLCFADMVLLYKLKIPGNPASSNPTGDILPTAFARSVSLITSWHLWPYFKTFVTFVN